MIGSTEPDSQRQRTNWHHGSPDGKESIGRCRLLQVAAQLVAKSISSVPKSIESHGALPGGPVVALGGRPKAPTAMDGSDANPGGGKGLKKRLVR